MLWNLYSKSPINVSWCNYHWVIILNFLNAQTYCLHIIIVSYRIISGIYLNILTRTSRRIWKYLLKLFILDILILFLILKGKSLDFTHKWGIRCWLRFFYQLFRLMSTFLLYIFYILFFVIFWVWQSIG